MGRPWALGKKEKKSKGSLAQPSIKGAPREPREKKWARLGYLGIAKTRERILGKCRKESAGTWIAQGSMLMDTRNEERYVPSAAHNPEENLWKQMVT